MLIVALTACGPGGCGPDTGPESGGELAPAPSRAAGQAAFDRPAAMVDGQPVGWDAIRPGLAELAGGPVLQEVVLDRRLATELRERALEVTPEVAARERTILVQTLGRDIGNRPQDEVEVDRVISEVRRSRGLGDARFAALLRRSAGLRLLIQDQVTVNEGSIRQAYAIRYGPRRTARIITLPTQAEAVKVLDQLVGAPEEGPRDTGKLHERFERAVREQSTDATRARGGLMDPMSVEDPTYPMVLRQAIGALKPGEISPVLAIDHGYAIVLLEGITPETGPTIENAHEELAALVRLRQERQLMDAKAAELLARPGVTILDRNLEWSWRASERP
jgi:hypothetical protein